jgi:hypothetical protein
MAFADVTHGDSPEGTLDIAQVGLVQDGGGWGLELTDRAVVGTGRIGRSGHTRGRSLGVGGRSFGLGIGGRSFGLGNGSRTLGFGSLVGTSRLGRPGDTRGRSLGLGNGGRSNRFSTRGCLGFGGLVGA